MAGRDDPIPADDERSGRPFPRPRPPGPARSQHRREKLSALIGGATVIVSVLIGVLGSPLWQRFTAACQNNCSPAEHTTGNADWFKESAPGRPGPRRQDLDCRSRR